MMDDRILLGQMIGTGALAFFALITWRIALLNGRAYANYGREALACCSAIFTLSAVTISLSLAGVMSPALSRTINLLSFIVAIMILAQTGAATMIEMRVQRKETR